MDRKFADYYSRSFGFARINDVTVTMLKAISRSCEIDFWRNFLSAMKN